MRDETKRSLKCFQNQVKSLNQTIEENISKVTKIELRSSNIFENVKDIKVLVNGWVHGMYSNQFQS